MNVLIIGSAPDAIQALDWDMKVFDQVVVINNAWRTTTHWHELIFPYDFLDENKPSQLLNHQKFVTEDQFVPAQNLFGGFVYAGATMAFTAGYWSLASHLPTRMCFLGCNMHYSQNGPTHFYGKGQPDPLRDDITLTSLRACSHRMLILAKMQGCDIVSLSTGETNLHVPQTSFDEFLDYQPAFIYSREKVSQALKYEKNLNYYVEDGRYWLEENLFCRDELKKLDQMWVDALKPTPVN